MLEGLIIAIFIPVIFALYQIDKEDKNRKQKNKLHYMTKSPYEKIIKHSPSMNEKTYSLHGKEYDGSLNKDFEK